MRNELPRLKQKIEHELRRLLPSERTEPVLLHRAMRYGVLAGGKRLRPMLVLLAGDIAGVDRKKLLPLACALEMIHNFSLVHDDLPAMDDDDFRRGKPTCHKVFGEAVAVLAGDALLTLGFEILARQGSAAAVTLTAQAIGSRGMAGGQALDILARGKKLPAGPKKRLDQMKTGRLFEACFALPLLFKEVSPATKKALECLGCDFGLGFQIRDDIEDREGDQAKLEARLAALRGRMQETVRSFGFRGRNLAGLLDMVYGK